MKLIDTSVLSSTKGYPGLANVGGQSVGNSPVHPPGNPSMMEGLDFQQQALLDMVDALSKALVSDPTKATWLYASYTGGGLYPLYVTGYVYYGGEVFFVPNQSIGPLVYPYYYAANISSNPTDNGSTAPLTTLSDGSTVSIHNQRTISFSAVSSGTGTLPNLGDWITTQVAQNVTNIATNTSSISTLNTNVTTLMQAGDFRNLQYPNTIGNTGGFGALTSSFVLLSNTDGGPVSYTTPNDGVHRNYYVMARVNTLLSVTTDGTNAKAQYQITIDGNERSFTLVSQTSPVGSSQMECVLTFGGTLPPATVIELLGMDASASGNSATVEIAELNCIAVVP